MKVILISVDSLRGDFFDICNKFGIRLNSLCALRESAIFFPNTFVHTPYTLPSHASMLTGLYPFNHGLRAHHGLKLRKGITTLLDIFDKTKIRTALFLGEKIIKPQLGYKNVNLVGKTSLRKIYKQIFEWKNQNFFLFIHYWNIHIPYIPSPAGDVRDSAFNFLTLLQLKGYLSERFYDNIMLRTSIKGMHILKNNLWRNRINNVRKKMRNGKEEEVKQFYAKAILLFDKFLGGIIRELKRRDLFDETVIIVTGDHGESFNEHNEILLEPFEYMHGHFLFNNVLRVPTFLKLENKSMSTISSFVQLVDIAPTILDLYGIEKPSSELDGISLLKQVDNLPKGRTIYFETLRNDTRKVGIISGPIKIIRDLKINRDYIFDLSVDPKEKYEFGGQITKQGNDIKKKLSEFLIKNNISLKKGKSDNKMAKEETEELRERLRMLGYLG